jgi:phosphoribosylformimino-5-aminoimidazole carboxamide ribotide isomerase
MNIIPVIDLLNGVVVHAKQGQRTHYQPISSKLTTSTQANDIVKAFLTLYPFNRLYIADLNAIQKIDQKRPHHFEIIQSIQENFPSIEIWLDAGIRQVADLSTWEKLNIRHVIGTENIANLQDYLHLSESLREKMVLSLDFMPQGYQGPAELLAAEYWPRDVIAMTLSQVGSNNGVDIETLNSVIQKSKNHHVYAAGGVRNNHELIALSQRKIHGVLVASALHSRQLSHTDIAQHMH